MNIKKAIKYALIVIPLLLLAKFGIEKVIYDSNKIPEINPHPKEKLRIYGKFPLDPNTYCIKATIRYIATNPKCDNVIWLAGARFAQDEQIDLNATISDNHYDLSIYRDYYKQGVCDWKVEDIFVETIQKGANTSTYRIDFSANKVGTYDSSYQSSILQAKSPLNLVCNNEYVSKDYTRYFCKDSVIGLIEKAILFPDSQKEFEVNFQQMAEPIQKIKQGEK